MIIQYFKAKEKIEKKIAYKIYNQILNESSQILKNNNFFKKKNYNTSFEIVSILLIIYFKKNINNKNMNYKDINDELIKLFIKDLDESLRTKGIGDMSIGKYVKSFVKKFYYRLSKFPKKNENIDIESLDNYLGNFDFTEKQKNREFSKKLLEFYISIKI